MRCLNKHDHSDKYCCCGGHNNRNHKKHKTHNSTRKKLEIKAERRFKLQVADMA